MSLAGLAKETVAIVERGGYELPSGARVDIRDTVARAIGNTRLYYPSDFDGLDLPVPTIGRCVLEVTGETTAEAARRLVEHEDVTHVAALNFASAKNPGGGFLGRPRSC
jgi:uncharacterized protein (TIGR02452 family)